MVTWILDSGPMGLITIGLALLGVLWAALGTSRPVRWWIDVAVAWVCVLLTAGVTGTASGFIVGTAALSTAPAASKAAMLAQMMSVAPRPLWLALAGIGMVAVAATLAHVAGGRGEGTPARPPGYGWRLIGIMGLLVSTTVPLCAVLTMMLVMSGHTAPIGPDLVSRLLLSTGGLSMVSSLGYLVYAPLRIGLAVRERRHRPTP